MSINHISGDSLRHLFSYLPESCLFHIAATCKTLRRLVFSLPQFTHVTVNIDRHSLNDPYRSQNVLTLFPNAVKFHIFGKFTQSWGVLDVPVCFGVNTLVIDCPIDKDFLNILQYCPELMDLQISQLTSNISTIIPYLTPLSHLQNLQLPETTLIDSPQLISQLLTSCSLTCLTLRYTTRADPHFWETVSAGTPPEKKNLLKSLQLICYGLINGEEEDVDLHISEINRNFPELFRLSFKGSLEYNCLGALLTEPPHLQDIILPWPQKDYSEKMEKFVSEYPKIIYGIQLQSRNNQLLQILNERHGKGLVSLHLACTEEVTTEGVVGLLSGCPLLQELSLFFYEGHVWDRGLGEVIRDLPELEKLWLATISTMVINEPVHIEHPTIRKIDLREFRVHELKITCPNIKELIPPLWITNLENAHEIYEICYPGDLVIRVAELYMVKTVRVRPTDTVEVLKQKIMNELGKVVVMSVIVEGKALKKNDLCGQCLRNGSLVKLLC